MVKAVPSCRPEEAWKGARRGATTRVEEGEGGGATHDDYSI